MLNLPVGQHFDYCLGTADLVRAGSVGFITWRHVKRFDQKTYVVIQTKAMTDSKQIFFRKGNCLCEIQQNNCVLEL